jgi:PAS domain S-box-containing protein
MDLREVLSRHRAGVAIASIGWIMNIPYWLNEYRFHSALGHSMLEHLSEDLYLHIMVFGTIPIFMVLGYFWDKKAKLERAVSLRSDFLQAILDNMEDGLTVYDGSRRIVEANRGAEKIFGYPEGGLLGKRCLDLVKCEIDECPAMEAFKRKVRVNGGVFEQVKHRGGRKAFVKVSSYPIKSDGQVDYVVEVIRNVTEKVLKKKDVKLLSDIEDMLDSKVAKEKVLKEITRRLTEEFGYEVSGIGVLKSNGKKLVPIAWAVNPRIKELAGEVSKDTAIAEIALSQGSPLYKVVKEGKALLTGNLFQLASEQPSEGEIKKLAALMSKSKALRYAIAAPTKAHGKVLGIIGVASADELGEDDALRLTRIGKIAAQAL